MGLNPALTPADTVKGEWKHCSPQTVGDFPGWLLTRP
jgi:hypothetical protein